MIEIVLSNKTKRYRLVFLGERCTQMDHKNFQNQYVSKLTADLNLSIEPVYKIPSEPLVH